SASCSASGPERGGRAGWASRWPRSTWSRGCCSCPPIPCCRWRCSPSTCWSSTGSPSTAGPAPRLGRRDLDVDDAPVAPERGDAQRVAAGHEAALGVAAELDLGQHAGDAALAAVAVDGDLRRELVDEVERLLERAARLPKHRPREPAADRPDALAHVAGDDADGVLVLPVVDHSASAYSGRAVSSSGCLSQVPRSACREWSSASA